jgi:hypothetical protein
MLLGCPYYAGALSIDADTMVWGGEGVPGIAATGDWASEQTSLSWDIDQVSEGVWSYDYTWTAPRKALSHIIIEVTAGAQQNEFWGWDFNGTPVQTPTFGYVPMTYDPGPGNPLMPADIFGMKIDLAGSYTTFNFSFLSSHSPTWGDFFAKDGVARTEGEKVPVVAYNSGFSPLPSGAGNDAGAHVAVPNGVHTVPDSGSTVLLLGMALTAIEFIRRRK